MNGSDYPALYQNRHCYQSDGADVFILNTKTQYFGKIYDFSCFRLKTLPKSEISNKVKGISVGSTVFQVSEANIKDYLTSKLLIKKNFSEFINSFSIRHKCNCVCTFMKELYVIKIGQYFGEINTYSCLKYNLNRKKWINTAAPNEIRYFAASAVFEGKIVVSGGIEYYKKRSKRTVEAYDHYENQWAYLPEMIKGRSDHSLVSMGNKLFVIDGWTTNSCEVFDSKSRKFSCINFTLEYFSIKGACRIGNNIALVGVKLDAIGNEYEVVIYDVESNTFSIKA